MKQVYLAYHPPDMVSLGQDVAAHSFPARGSMDLSSEGKRMFRNWSPFVCHPPMREEGKSFLKGASPPSIPFANNLKAG
jgi:hypothetical protein